MQKEYAMNYLASFRTLLLCTLTLSILYGCDSGNGGGPVTLDPTGDEDNDGLENSVETTGWEIDIDSLGYGLDAPDRLVTLQVTSDPLVADTDGDGLTDQEERAINTNPNSSDTDGDSLTDFDEVRIYKSSPTSKDTDGDATAAGSSTVPNASLFDGEEVNTLLTSPLDEDTDGDGITDLTELTNSGATRALISDVPDINLHVYDNPAINYFGTVTDSTGNEQTVGSTFAQGTSSSNSTSRSDTKSSSTAITESRTAGGSVSAGFPWSASVEGHYETTSSNTSSYGMESTTTSDSTRSAEMSQEQSNVLALSSNREVTYEGGYIDITFDLGNEGDLPVNLSNIAISAFQFDENNDLLPVGVLSPTSGNLWQLGVGNSSTGNIAHLELTSPQVIETLLTNRSGLLFKVANYTLVDAISGVNYVVQDSIVKQHTGKLVLDYGQGNVKSYHIATNVRRDPTTNNPLGVSMQEVFGPKRLNLTYAVQPNSTDATEVLTGLQLSSTNPAMREIGTAESDGFWMLISEQGYPTSSVNFSDIVLNQGDQISLVFLRDQDSDGLYEREEKLLGTDDLNTDTDGDTLTDFEEARTGWTVPFYPAGNIVFSDPRNTDTDGDLLDDAAEKLAQTDPRNADTDSDGTNDNIDPEPLVPGSYTIVDAYTWSGRTMAYSNVTLNGGATRDITVTPGSSVIFATNWNLSVSGASYCPGCIVQFYTGLQNIDESCLVSRGMADGVTDSGATSLTFNAPTAPGIYLVNTKISLQYSCVDVNVGVDPNNALAIIRVQ